MGLYFYQWRTTRDIGGLRLFTEDILETVQNHGTYEF